MKKYLISLKVCCREVMGSLLDEAGIKFKQD